MFGGSKTLLKKIPHFYCETFLTSLWELMSLWVSPHCEFFPTETTWIELASWAEVDQYYIHSFVIDLSIVGLVDTCCLQPRTPTSGWVGSVPMWDLLFLSLKFHMFPLKLSANKIKTLMGFQIFPHQDYLGFHLSILCIELVQIHCHFVWLCFPVLHLHSQPVQRLQSKHFYIFLTFWLFVQHHGSSFQW